MKKRIRLLVVEDLEFVRQTTIECLKSELKDLGIIAEVHQAMDGFDAIPLCRQINYDVILMDMIMKKIHGEETIKKIKSFRPDAKILIVSGYEDNAAIPRCVEEKLVNVKVFGKPVNFTQLAKYIEELI